MPPFSALDRGHMFSNLRKDNLKKVRSHLKSGDLKSDLPPSDLTTSVKSALNYLTRHQRCGGETLLLVGYKQRREEICRDSP